MTQAFQRFTRCAALLTFVALLASIPAAAQKPETFAERLAKNHFQLEVKDGHLSGTGVPILQSALTDAEFVLLGEDHGISQVPQFDSAICTMMGPAGFHTLAIEAGPTVAAELENWATLPDGHAKVAAFEKEYPDSIAFYNWNEDYDFLSHCAATSTGGKFRIWGLDQELMGASRILLTRILEQHPGPEATNETQRLLAKNDEDYAVAAKSGNPNEIFMLAASDADLAHLRDLLASEGNATAQSLLDALIESREIYQKNMNGSGFDSNRQRALLMKHTFMQDFDEASRSDARPKIIFKFGAWHLFKGINPLHNNDLGNLVAELADYERSKSVHILILAMKGKQLHFTGIGHPYAPADFSIVEDKDSDFLYLKPIFDTVKDNNLNLYDLRAFRKGFRSQGPVDSEMERLIFGYDFLVLIPESVPSTQIGK